MSTSTRQFGRKVSLQVFNNAGDAFGAPSPPSNKLLAIDLSEMHFQFNVQNADKQSPTNATIRIFNLSDTTVQKIIKYDFTRVVLQAGYEGSFGVIFDGNIKQFRVGRLDGRDTYLDLLAADGDTAFNYSIVSESLAAEKTSNKDQLDLIGRAFSYNGVTIANSAAADPIGDSFAFNGVPQGVQPIDGAQPVGGILPRGKVFHAQAKVIMADRMKTMGCSWSIQNGKINIIPLDTYLPGEAIVLTAGTGLVGVPEVTQQGITCRCLLNPRIVVGGRIRIDNASLNQTLGTTPYDDTNLQDRFDSWVGTELFADVSRDGFYRVFIAEHEGDTRSNNWYTSITALAIDPSSQKVRRNG